MSSRRSIVWLLFFVALAVAAHVLVSTRAGRAIVRSRLNALAPRADRADFLEFSPRGTPSAVIVRSDRWKMISPFAACADPEAVLRILDALAFSEVTDVLTEPEMRRLGRSPEDFGLAEPRLRVAVRRDGRETSVAFGSPTPGGDGVYASVSGNSGICVVASNVFARLDIPLDSLRDARLLSDDFEPVAAVDVRRTPGRFLRVCRTVSGAWQMQEPLQASIAPSRVTDLLKMLSDARAARFVWPVTGEKPSATPPVSLLAGYGLDADSTVTVTLSGANGTSRFVSFGGSADGGSVYALAQNGTVIATVPAGLRDRLVAAAESLVDLKLFPCEESAVTFLSIADGDLVYLVARTPDGLWRIDSPVAAPADQEVVQAVIRTVLSLRTTERDPRGLLVSVSTNLPAVAVSRDALLVQNRLEDLRAKTVLRIPSDRIRRLSVSGADGRHEAVAWDAANRTWMLAKPDGATLNGLALAGVFGALDPLEARSIVRLRIAASEAGNYGLEHPRFTIAIDQAADGAVRRNVMIGSPVPGGGAYATVGSTDAVVVLPEDAVRALTTPFSTAE